MYFLFVILSVLFIFILYVPLHLTYTQIYQEKTKRDIILNDDDLRKSMQNRRYAPLHTLPTVRWHSNFDTLEGSSSCFSVPTLVTTTNTGTFDCSAVCNDKRAAYFFVNTNDMYIVNGERLSSGGYCTMNSVPRNCNSETSLILYSVNQWTCIAEDPRYFAGEGNLIQVAGRQHSDEILSSDINKIVLWDNRLNRQVNPAVNTFRNSWDERLEDGRRRFEVRCGALDKNHNQMFLNPYNEIECLPNVCTSTQWIHRDVKPNFEKGICECGASNVTRVEHVDQNDPSSKCAGVTNRLNKEEREFNFRVECLSLDTPVSEFNKNKLLCPPSLFNQNTDFAYHFTLKGVIPLSGNGIDEPTTSLWKDTRNRVAWYTASR
ncbi:PIF2 [Pieris rapae granulovirus Wuhan]|uniref:PIF2 n=1 Tax=Pieris rapae granulovirus Wuhan TaxID=2848030 RepID=D2J4K7_9BBAC|nr:PIF2 [Betabaculovirus arrapae]ACZ63526.1 PIF2 [Betabaculovirus arrapae]ADO85466.1 pif-2 [Pieris rapae granulovirus]UOS85714.1 PIF2 [Pieris rapae granulovirus]